LACCHSSNGHNTLGLNTPSLPVCPAFVSIVDLKTHEHTLIVLLKSAGFCCAMMGVGAECVSALPLWLVFWRVTKAWVPSSPLWPPHHVPGGPGVVGAVCLCCGCHGGWVGVACAAPGLFWLGAWVSSQDGALQSKERSLEGRICVPRLPDVRSKYSPTADCR